MNELRQQLAAIKAQREALAAQEAEASEQAELEAELAREAQALKDDQALPALVKEHGALGFKLCALKSPMGLIVLKKPPQAKWKHFQHLISQDNASMADEAEKLVRFCRVYPEVGKFDEMLEEMPGIVNASMGAINQLVVSYLEVKAGK